MQGKKILIKWPDGTHNSLTKTVKTILGDSIASLPESMQLYPHTVIESPEKWRKFKRQHSLKGYRRITVKFRRTCPPDNTQQVNS